MTVQKGKLAHIPIDKIRQNPVALREVDKTSEEYKGLVDSIRRNGILNPPSVREIKGEGDTVLYGVIDGLHRFTAAQDAGLDSIPAHILSMEEAEIEEAQILANVHKIETKPVEYSNQLKRMLGRNPTMPMSELATRLSKTTQWLNERLGLTKLVESIGALVDEGKITLANAYALAKLPPEVQPEYVDRAMTLQPAEFVPQVNKHVKELRDAKRQGRDPNPQFEPTARLQKISAIKDESASTAIGKQLCGNLKTPLEGFKAALDWVLHLDSLSVAEEKAKWEKRKAEQDENRKKRELERQQKREKEAQAKQNEIQGQLAATAG